MSNDLFTLAHAALLSSDTASKCMAATSLVEDWRSGSLVLDRTVDLPPVVQPGRPLRPELVSPGSLPKRKPGSVKGRAALIHAVAHIELNAIDLALDAVCRFRDMPEAYYGDWLQVAAEEAKHFRLLCGRLAELGFDYGDFSAHNGLWELALSTARDPLHRMALVPRVMEARGLDVTPGMIGRFRNLGDEATAAVLEVILEEEVGHVAAGTRWFRYLCAERGLDPEPTYFRLISEYLGDSIRCPLHQEARRRAGFTDSELRTLETLCKRS